MQTTPDQVLIELRDAIREAHGMIKDLQHENREAKKIVVALADLTERIIQKDMEDVILEGIQGNMDTFVAELKARFASYREEVKAVFDKTNEHYLTRIEQFGEMLDQIEESGFMDNLRHMKAFVEARRQQQDMEPLIRDTNLPDPLFLRYATPTDE